MVCGYRGSRRGHNTTRSAQQQQQQKKKTRKLEKDKSCKTKDVRVKLRLFQPSAFFLKHRNNNNPRLRSVRGEINVEVLGYCFIYHHTYRLFYRHVYIQFMSSIPNCYCSMEMGINLSLTYIGPTIPSMASINMIGVKISISIHGWMELDIDLQSRLCTLNQR